MSINTFYLISSLCAIQNHPRAMSISRYYLLSRDIAISHHHQEQRKINLIGDVSLVHQDRERVMSFSEIDETFVEQDFTLSHKQSCPSLSDYNTTAIKVCPTHRILDVDVNRLPIALFQVQCKCLHCLTPWTDYHISRRCTPLFQFFKVLRVVGRKSSGKPIYALVWEPVSYACACTKRRKGRIRYVSPP